jgi:hypothetical protein
MDNINFTVRPDAELFSLVSVTLDTELNEWLLNWCSVTDNTLYFNVYTELSTVKKIFDHVCKRGNRVEMIVNAELQIIVFKFTLK